MVMMMMIIDDDDDDDGDDDNNNNDWVDQKKNFEGFVWSFLSITGLRSQRQFAPK